MITRSQREKLIREKLMICSHCGQDYRRSVNCKICDKLRDDPTYFEMRQDIEEFRKNGLQMIPIEELLNKGKR